MKTQFVLLAIVLACLFQGTLQAEANSQGAATDPACTDPKFEANFNSKFFCIHKECQKYFLKDINGISASTVTTEASGSDVLVTVSYTSTEASETGPSYAECIKPYVVLTESGATTQVSLETTQIDGSNPSFKKFQFKILSGEFSTHCSVSSGTYTCPAAVYFSAAVPTAQWATDDFANNYVFTSITFNVTFKQVLEATSTDTVNFTAATVAVGTNPTGTVNLHLPTVTVKDGVTVESGPQTFKLGENRIFEVVVDTTKSTHKFDTTENNTVVTLMNAADYDAAETTKIVVPYNKLTIEPQAATPDFKLVITLPGIYPGTYYVHIKTTLVEYIP